MKFQSFSLFSYIPIPQNFLHQVSIWILMIGVIETNQLVAQSSPYAYLDGSGSEVVFGDLKTLHHINTPIDKNHYEESFKLSQNDNTKALNLHCSFVVFQSESESSSDIYRVNSNLIFMNRAEFKSLSLSLARGDNFSVFQNEFDILISERLAHKIFGSEDPINKILIMDDQYAVLIKGVFKDSDLPLIQGMDFIAGIPTYKKINGIGKGLAFSLPVSEELIQ